MKKHYFFGHLIVDGKKIEGDEAGYFGGFPLEKALEQAFFKGSLFKAMGHDVRTTPINKVCFKCHGYGKILLPKGTETPSGKIRHRDSTIVCPDCKGKGEFQVLDSIEIRFHGGIKPEVHDYVRGGRV